jgi:hypothetical protein
MYYNTTNLKLDDLKKEMFNAANQEQRIYKIFQGLPMKAAGPTTIHNLYVILYGKETPLTSIRRAITNLTNKGKIEKTSNYTKGSYNKKEYIWKLK